jgi:serine/threonine-protein kinase RsbW
VTTWRKAEPVPVPEGIVHLRVPAQPVHLRLVRLMIADLAGQLDFDLESISELRIAADEACAELIGVAAGADADLECEFRVSGRGIELRAIVPSKPGASLDLHGFGWQVLATMVDEVEPLDEAALRSANGALVAISPNFVGIRLAKRDSRDDT